MIDKERLDQIRERHTDTSLGNGRYVTSSRKGVVIVHNRSDISDLLQHIDEQQDLLDQSTLTDGIEVLDALDMWNRIAVFLGIIKHDSPALVGHKWAYAEDTDAVKNVSKIMSLLIELRIIECVSGHGDWERYRTVKVDLEKIKR